MNGVSFGDIHSYEDLHLILLPFAPTPATPKTSFLEVPGRDGTLDLTEANGGVKYNDRVFAFTFVVAPGDTMTFDERVTAVSNAINGVRCNIILDRDPAYYWVGRCEVSKLTRSRSSTKIVVKATVQPYKLKRGKTVSDHYGSVDSSINITLHNEKMPSVPQISVFNDSTVTFKGMTYELKEGTNRIFDICLTEGENNLVVSGASKVQFSWQEGAL